ncbi:5'-3' exonuclease [Streptomyces sp. 4N509B]|uniref:5'-3' exonuclease n=1 Tax=Streptomyces sp. 4N509B TaxID=3457413 RepID=UPI003FD654D9
MTAPAPLLLIDGHHLLYRAWFGFPTRIHSRDGERDLTGVFGFAALLRKAHREHCPDHETLVVFDAEDGSAARRTTDPTYKANRTDADHTPIHSLPPIRRLLDHAGIRWLEHPGAEGDDVLATLATQAADAHRPTVVMSGDKDLFQLLDTPGLRLLNTQLAADRRFLHAADVTARYSVTPAQWPDYRALTGDPADNIPGVPGIGPATARRLLADGRHLDALAHATLDGLARPLALLRTHWEAALRWRELIRLTRKLPLPNDLLTTTPTPVMSPAAALLEDLDLW